MLATTPSCHTMKIEGDLENLAEVHTNNIVEVLEINGFTTDAFVTVQAVGQKGDNYVACVKRIVAEDKDGKTLNMIAKIAPSNEMIRQLIHVDVLFLNEITMYTEVLPKLAKLQNGLDIPEEDKLHFPICYGVITEAPNEFILLEDLKVREFEIPDRMISLTNEQLRMVLKRLATLHSLSYLLKHREPELFAEYRSRLRNIWVSSETSDYGDIMELGIIQILEKEDYKNKTRGLMRQLPKVVSQLDKTDKESKYSVILHGDCWTNNVMYRFEENRLADCILIDYQIARVSSPAFELMYLIFNCTDREAQSKYYFEWLDYYHKALDDALSNFGLKTSLVYPRDKLDADLKRYGKVGYGVSLILSNILVREAGETIDISAESQVKLEELDKNDVLGLSKCRGETVVKLKKRFNDVCASFIEYGYI